MKILQWVDLKDWARNKDSYNIKQSSPVVIIIPGLTGGSESSYARLS